MMESVLEDVPLTDTYSHNMVSSCDSLRRVLSVPEAVDENNLRKAKMNGESSSLTNLSQAILNRRKVQTKNKCYFISNIINLALNKIFEYFIIVPGRRRRRR